MRFRPIVGAAALAAALITPIAAAGPPASAAPAPLVTVVPTYVPVIDSTGLHFRGVTIPESVVKHMSPLAIRSTESTIAGQQVANPLTDVIHYTALGFWGDVTMGFYNGDGIDWIQGQMSAQAKYNYPYLSTPAEIGPGINVPFNDFQLAHDITTDLWFIRYYPGYDWPNGSWVGVQLGPGQTGPVVGWNYDPAPQKCERWGGFCPVLTASAGAMGPNEVFNYQCTGVHERFNILMAEFGHFTSGDYLYYVPPNCLNTAYQAAGVTNGLDVYYSDVGLCS